MAKVLLFADAHIHTHKNSLRRLQHCLDALKWVFQTAVDRGIKDVIFLGDLFQDREKIQVLTYQRTYEIINKYAGGDSPKINLSLLVGNHDMWYADKTDISSVYPFGSITSVDIIHKCCTRTIGGLDIDFLPFTLNPIEAIQDFKATPTAKPSPVLCGHIALDGAKLNSFYQADVSVEYDGDMVKVGSDKFQSWQRVFLGHYHGEQRIGQVEYVGSTLELNYAEAFQEKHIIVLDTETLETEYIKNTFSPRHLIIKEDDLHKYDLNNAFLRLIPSDISAADLMDMQKQLMEDNSILTFEFSSKPGKDDEDTKKHIEDIKSILSQDQEEMLAQYAKAVGYGDLEYDKLIKIGVEFCQKSQIE